MPRYYKDKIFNEHEKAIMLKQYLEMSDIEYHKELKRLEKIHRRPFQYMEEALYAKHESITESITKTQKI